MEVAVCMHRDRGKVTTIGDGGLEDGVGGGDSESGPFLINLSALVSASICSTQLTSHPHYAQMHG